MNKSWLSGLSLCVALGVGCEKTEEQPSGMAAALEQAEPTPAPAPAPAPPAAPTPPTGARVFFVEPADSAEVKGPAVDGKVSVTVKMGAENIAVAEAGKQVQGAGHHHLIVDGEFVAMGSVVAKDDTHLHYGKGQTEATVMLTPGEHVLTLQFADGAHISYGPTLSANIKVKVVATP